MPIEGIARYLAETLARGAIGPAPLGSSAAQLLKLGSEDLKAFYFEGALAMPGNKTAEEIDDWVWNRTELGRILRGLKPVCLASDDEKVRRIGAFTLVPHHRADH